MKPRTKLQHHIVHLSSLLPNIDKEIKQYTIKELFAHNALSIKNHCICSECGKYFDRNKAVANTYTRCPHCRSKQLIVESRKKHYTEVCFVAQADVINNIQYVRYFEVVSFHKLGRKASYNIKEVLQQYYTDEKMINIARSIVVNWSTASWAWNSPLSIKIDNSNRYSSYKISKYNISHTRIYPNSRFLDKYKMLGINTDLVGITICDAINEVPFNSKYETLLKCGYYEILSYILYRRVNFSTPLWNAIRMCIRQKYQITNYQMWLDYIEMLIRLKKDTCNAFYSCPKDLVASHDQLVKQIQKIDEKIARQKEIERAKKKEMENQLYIERIKNFLDVEIKSKDITIRPLRSVAEFAIEGDVMHNCVYSNRYYEREKSLVLTATNNQGDKIATIEVVFPNFKIAQIYGKCNEQPKEYEDIKQLLTRKKRYFLSKLKTA